MEKEEFNVGDKIYKTVVSIDFSNGMPTFENKEFEILLVTEKNIAISEADCRVIKTDVKDAIESIGCYSMVFDSSLNSVRCTRYSTEKLCCISEIKNSMLRALVDRNHLKALESILQLEDYDNN